MILDAQLLFSDAQAVTAAAASDNIVDLGAVRRIGVGRELYVVVVVDVAMTDAGSDSTLTVALEGDSAASFTPDGTDDLFVIPALAAVGDTFIARISPVMDAAEYRYIRLKYTPNNGNLSTGSFTAFICQDIAKYSAYAKGYTIS